MGAGGCAVCVCVLGRGLSADGRGLAGYQEASGPFRLWSGSYTSWCFYASLPKYQSANLIPSCVKLMALMFLPNIEIYTDILIFKMNNKSILNYLI